MKGLCFDDAVGEASQGHGFQSSQGMVLVHQNRERFLADNDSRNYYRRWKYTRMIGELGSQHH